MKGDQFVGAMSFHTGETIPQSYAWRPERFGNPPPRVMLAMPMTAFASIAEILRTETGFSLRIQADLEGSGSARGVLGALQVRRGAPVMADEDLMWRSHALLVARTRRVKQARTARSQDKPKDQ